MDTLIRTILLYQDELNILLAGLVFAITLHYLTKIWSAPSDAILGAILGLCIGTLCSVLFLTRHFWGIAVSPRVFWFAALYLWCICGMVFFAAKNTHRMKLFLGLASQAGILYALFVIL